MMNKFENRWFFVIIGEVYALSRKRVVTFIIVQRMIFSSYCKRKQPKKYMVSQDALSVVKAATQFYNIMS